MLYQAQLAGAGFELTTLVVIGTYYTGSYEFNYHMIMSAPITSIKKRYCYVKKIFAVKSNNDSIILWRSRICFISLSELL